MGCGPLVVTRWQRIQQLVLMRAGAAGRS
jgi:hypothetical protein